MRTSARSDEPAPTLRSASRPAMRTRASSPTRKAKVRRMRVPILSFCMHLLLRAFAVESPVCGDERLRAGPMPALDGSRPRMWQTVVYEPVRDVVRSFSRGDGDGECPPLRVMKTERVVG